MQFYGTVGLKLFLDKSFLTQNVQQVHLHTIQHSDIWWSNNLLVNICKSNICEQWTALSAMFPTAFSISRTPCRQPVTDFFTWSSAPHSTPTKYRDISIHPLSMSKLFDCSAQDKSSSFSMSHRKCFFWL